MEIHFCDLCNESVPESDLALGRAVRRAGRVVCHVCERAMSVPIALGAFASAPRGARPAAAVSAAPPSYAAASASARTSSGALFVGLVAVLFAAGAAALLTVELNRERGLREAAAASQQVEIEALARRLEAARGSLSADSEVLASDLRGRLAHLDGVLRTSLERQGGRLDALERTLADLGQTLASLRGDQARANEESGRRLDEFAARLASRREELTRLEARIEGLALEVASGVLAAQAGAAPRLAGEPAWTPRLVDLSSSEASLRYYAVLDLAASGDPAVAPHLAALLGDSDTFVRMAVARVLGELGAPAGIEPLIDALEDPMEEVRETAVLSLRAITGRNFRFDPFANPAERARRVAAWRDWWVKAKADYL